MARQDSFSKFPNISLSSQRQLVVLGIGSRIATNILCEISMHQALISNIGEIHIPTSHHLAVPQSAYTHLHLEDT